MNDKSLFKTYQVPERKLSSGELVEREQAKTASARRKISLHTATETGKFKLYETLKNLVSGK